MTNDSDLFEGLRHELEDFWGRRDCGPRFRRRERIFGWPVTITSNLEEALQAIEISLPLFSKAPEYDVQPLELHIAARDMPLDPGPVPEDLFTRIQYSGHGDWLTMHLGAWGLAHIALDLGRAVVVAHPILARDAGALSRFVLNTIFLNLLENRGFSLLHAASVARGDRVVLLVGGHNSGKSTTALRLALHGHDFLADSMGFVGPTEKRIQLLGFPIGQAKVRDDMRLAFPELGALFEREITREEIKYGVDLRQLPMVTVREEAVQSPATIDLLVVQRHENTETWLEPVSREEMYGELFGNSAYWHSTKFWQSHLARLRRLVDAARCRRLYLGSAIESLLAALAD